MTLEAGTALGPYRVTRKLGAGGMGEVYVALDPRLNREVAIKVLPGELRDSESLRRFQQEANAVAALNHTNIVQIFDVGSTESGEPFLVMELLEGESLRARMASKPMALRKAIEISAQIARALGAAHAKGIVHRDLKPENVFLTKQGPTKILDFGLAKLGQRESLMEPDATRALFTKPGMVMGTVGYMAPELVEGQGADGRADIFSLGILMWEMLSGLRPFSKPSSIDTLHAILREDPPDIPEALGLPPAMEKILRRCLEKLPEDRFQNAGDLAFQLENLAEASSSIPTAKLPSIRELRASWRTRLHRILYPLPINLPPRLRVCFWDRLQLSLAYALLLGLCITAFVASRTHLGSLGFGPLGKRELAKHFVPALNMSGNIQSAAISRDGRHTLVALADETGHTSLIYQQTDQSPVILGKAPAEEVLALANSGSALLRNPGGELYLHEMGETATPLKIATHVLEADLCPDGSKVALLRHTDNRFTLEYPQGSVCYTSTARLRDLKVSPSGDMLAFFERDANSGLFNLKVWKNGKIGIWKGDARLCPKGAFQTSDLRGIAWNATSDGLYLALQGNLLALLHRNDSLVLHRNAGSLRLRGASQDGPLLDVGSELTIERGRLPGPNQNPAKEQDLDWTGGSIQRMSEDGQRLLVARDSELWMLPSNRSPGRKIGTGSAEDLSADGKILLTTNNDRTLAVPTEGGDTILVGTKAELQALGFGFTGESSGDPKFALSRDGKWAFVFQKQRLARKNLQHPDAWETLQAPIQNIASDWRMDTLISPDGNRLALQVRESGERRWCVILDVHAGTQEASLELQDSERLVAWTAPGTLLLFNTLKGSGDFQSLDLKTAQRSQILSAAPPYPNTSARFRSIRWGNAGAFYTYRYTTTGLSQLVIGKGL